MVNLIVNEIVSQLAALTFLDKITGITKVASVSDGAGNIQKFPIALNTDVSTCSDSQLLDYVPDSTKTSIIYFEDRGTQVTGWQDGAIGFTANFTLICWFNYNKINPALTNTSLIAANLIKLLPFGNMGNIYPLMGIFLELTSQQSNEGGVFGKYSYKEEINQFITYPYDYVALDLKADFRVRPECVDDLTLNPAEC